MNKLLILLSLFCFLGFTDINTFKTHRIESKAINSNFDWLLGTWKRTNEAEGSETYEYWKKINENELSGWGLTLKASDTIWQESIKLIKSEDTWNFEVLQQDAIKPTIFKVTKIEMESFTCENKANEFPKKIRYAKVEKGLNAVISGDGKVILFQFTKAN